MPAKKVGRTHFCDFPPARDVADFDVYRCSCGREKYVRIRTDEHGVVTRLWTDMGDFSVDYDQEAGDGTESGATASTELDNS